MIDIEGAGLEITARTKADDHYRPLDECGVSVSLPQIRKSTAEITEISLLVTNKNACSWDGVIKHTLSVAGQNSRFFLPAFLYGRNRPDNPRGKFPRLVENALNPPRSSYWMVRADRLSHPVAAIQQGGYLYAIDGSPYRETIDGKKRQWDPCHRNGLFDGYNGFYCDCNSGEIGYTLGYENAPALYIHNNDGYSEKTFGAVSLLADEAFEYTIRIHRLSGPLHVCMARLIESIYSSYHQAPRTRHDLQAAAKDIASAICDDSYLPELRNYSTQLHLTSEVSTHFSTSRLYKTENGIHYLAIPSISWTGGLQCATPALLAGHRFANEKWLNDSRECIENIVSHSLNPRSGLPYDSFDVGSKTWVTRGWWTGYLDQPGHSSYLVGQAMYFVLKAAMADSMHGCRHETWVAFAKNVLARFLATRDEEGLFPIVWDENDGHGVDYDGFSGCWCAAAGALYCKLTDDLTILPELRKSLNAYRERFILAGECYGTPHDTDKAVDSEGVLAFIRACRLLHEITHDPHYLEWLLDGINYELTFKFCYNSPIQLEPLKSLVWSSCGGTVTSTANPHIHPMSSSILDEYLYAARAGGSSYLMSRLNDTLLWSLQVHNGFDGEFGFGKKGWMTERFCHSEGLLLETNRDESPASVWFCYLPWAAGCVLEGLCGDIWDFAS